MGEALESADEELRDLAERAEAADEGTGFLLRKQYRQRLSERLQLRRSAVADEVREAIEPHAEVLRSGGGSGVLADDGDVELETVAECSLLPAADRESAIGDALEPDAEHEAYEVDYTGPWPLYGFAPDIGERGDDGA
jgi:hypothetical protein